jgi:hypothetical protein
MIWESHYWKEPLLKSASWLRRVRVKETSGEKLFVRLEKELLLGFYSVRKLLDTVKLSDSTKAKNYQVMWFKNSSPVDFLNWHCIDRIFDLGKTNQETRNIRFICDRFIHSYVFLPDFEDEKFNGVYIASDSDKLKKLYFISADIIVAIFRLVGRDHPSHSKSIRNPETGEMEAYEIS